MRARRTRGRSSRCSGKFSLLTLDGDDHMRQRKLLLPPFHGEAVQRYRDLIAEIAAREVERWPVG